MSSGKKGKKTKGVTLALTDFLAETPGPTPTTRYVPRKTGNWADEVDNDEDFYDSSRSKEKVVLPTGPRSTWGPDIDDNKIPKNPPFLAYISNLPYEVDEDEISAFFKDLKIVNVRLPRDDRPGGMGKLKGFGYVEFENRQSLVSALSMPDMSIKSRRMRIDVADQSTDNDRRRGGRDMMRGDMMSRDRPDGPDRTLGDWRSGPRDDFGPDSDRDRGGGFGRDRDGGFDRGNRSGGGRRDFGSGGFREGFGDRDRDRGGGFRDGFGGDRGRDNFGGDRDRGRYGDREGGFSDRRGGDRDRDYGRDGGFGSRRGFSDFRDGGGRDGGSFRSDGGGRDGGSFRNDGGGRDGGSFRSDGGGRDGGPPEKSEPRGRPRLNLIPRTKPIEEVAAPPPAPPPSKAPVSIFGAAKPVDTSAREREIEERLAREKGDAPRSSQKDERSEEARSKSGDEDGSQVPPKRKMEPAPAPSENYWAQRTQPTPSSRNDYPEGNGRVSPHSEPSDQEFDRGRRYQDRPNSPKRRSPDNDDQQQGSRRYQDRSDNSPRRRSPDHDDRQQGSRRYQDRPDSLPRRRSPEHDDERQGHSRYEDRSDSPGRRSQDRDSRAPQRKTYERDDRGQDNRGSRGSGSKGAGSAGERSGPPVRGVGDRPMGREGKSEREPSKKEAGIDDGTRMPKYHEEEVPNFAGSNKFAFLHSDDEPGSD